MKYRVNFILETDDNSIDEEEVNIYIKGLADDLDDFVVTEVEIEEAE